MLERMERWSQSNEATPGKARAARLPTSEVGEALAGDSPVACGGETRWEGI